MGLQGQRRKTPWYVITEIIFFILPLAGLWTTLKKMNRRAFGLTLVIIMVLGYSWSMLVSSHGWWQFNPQTMLGWQVLPHLPLEEALFYPLGGALSILVYGFLADKMANPRWKSLGFYFLFLALTLVVLGAATTAVANNFHPAYILSQVVLYNGLALLLWPVAGPKFHLPGLLVTIVILTAVGVFWNYVGFTQRLWWYTAVLGWNWPKAVPVDDWNFYIFAPLAAISLYILLDSKHSRRSTHPGDL